MVACAGISQRLVAPASLLPVLAPGQKSAASAPVGPRRLSVRQGHWPSCCNDGPSRTVRSGGECRGVSVGRDAVVGQDAESCRSNCLVRCSQAKKGMVRKRLHVPAGARSATVNFCGPDGATSPKVLLKGDTVQTLTGRRPFRSTQNGRAAGQTPSKRRSQVLVAARGALTESTDTGALSQSDGETGDSADIRGGLLNDAGQASVSGKVEPSGGQDTEAEKGGQRRSRWVADDGRVRGPGRSKSIAERHLETRPSLGSEAASLLDELQTVDSDPERMAILEKWSGSDLSDADLLELLRRQRGFRTARLFFDWMETQPGFRKGSPAAYHILIAFAHRSQKMDAIPGLTAHMDSRGIPFTAATYATLVDVYTRAKDLSYAQAWFDKLLAAEAANGWRPESAAYRAMMSMYEKVGKPSESVRIWRQLLARGDIRIGALQTYNALVDALGKVGRFEEAMGLLDEMRARGLQPNTMTYNMLINCYGKAGARHQALKLFDEMRRAGVAPDAVTFNTLISMHVRAEDYAAAAGAMQLLRQSGERPSEFTLNAMVRAYAKLGQAEGALDVYNKFREAGIAPSAVSYNSLLHLLASAGKADESEEILLHMQEGGTQTDDVTWNGLVNGHSKAGNYAKVLETFERMKAAGFAPDHVTYTPVVDALFKLRRDDEAMEMFDEMRARGLQPRSMTYGVMLIVCSRNDMLGEAAALLDEMRDRGVPPSDTHYITVVDGLVRTGRWEDAQKVYRAAREEGRAGAELYACLVCGLEAQGQRQQAEELFQSMKAAGVDTAEVIYGSVIAALGRLGQYEDAVAAFKDLETSDVQPKARTYSQIVSVYGKAGLVGPAEAAFQVAARAGEANLRVHNAMLDVYLRGGLYQEAEDWYRTMEDDGLAADEATCRTFLVRYAEAGLWQPASRWLNKTMSSNFLFEATTYNKVLRCFGSAGKIDLAWMLFHIMKKGIKAAKPISSTYNTMIGIMGEEGRYKDAAALVQEMRAEGVEITEITKAVLRRIVYAANTSSPSASARREVDVAIDRAFGPAAERAARRMASVGSKFVEGEFVPSEGGDADGNGERDTGLPDYLRELSKL